MKTTASRASAVSQTRGFGDLLYDKAGARPSLDLDFAGTSSLRDKITGEYLVDHTRASVGTYINSEGLIKEAITNLYLLSESFFDNHPYNQGGNNWTNNNVADPNGDMTADSWAYDSTRFGFFNQTSTSWMSGYPANYPFTITEEWVRHSVSVTTEANQTSMRVYTHRTADDINYNYQIVTVEPNTTYTYSAWHKKVGTKVIVWGVQLVKGSEAGEYVKTTTINSAPRFTHERVETGNLLTHSENFVNDNYVILNDSVSIQDYAGISPSGKYDAALITAIGSGAIAHNFRTENLSTVKVGKKYVVTFHAKPTATEDQIFVNLSTNTGSFVNQGAAKFTLSGNGTFSNTTGSGHSITKGDNGWYRCQFVTQELTTTVQARLQIRLQRNGTFTASNPPEALYIWGLQVEEGDSASTYVPSIDTFTSRAGSATYVDSAGLIKSANIKNELKYTSDLSNSYWAVNTGTKTVLTTSTPDGQDSVAKFTRNQNNWGRFYNSTGHINLDTNTTYTASVYAKADGNRYLHFRVGGSNAYRTGTAFDLQEGVVLNQGYFDGTQILFTPISSSIEDAGDGWFRCIITYNNINTNHIWFYPSNSATTTSDATGNGQSQLYWHPQIVEGTEAQDFISTGGSHGYGPRYSHDPETLTPTGLYLEPAATNVVSQNTTLSTWTKTRVNLAIDNNITNPDGSTGAAKISTDASPNTTKFIQAPDRTPASGTVVSFSGYFKYANHQYLDVYGAYNHWMNPAERIRLDLINGTVTTSSSYSATLTSLPNGWFYLRAHGPKPNTGSSSSPMYIWFIEDANSSQTSTTSHTLKEVYVWGLQTEQSSYPSSTIINNTNASITRQPDIYTSTANLTETFEPRGLLIEEERINLVPYSEDFSQSDWFKEGNITATTGYTSPRGDNTAYKIISPTVQTSAARLRWQFTSSTTGTYTVSMFAKPDGLRYLHLRVGVGGGGTTNFGHGFDLQEGIAILGRRDGTFTMSSTAHSIEKLPNGWFKITASGSVGTGTAHVMPYLSNSATTTTFTGNGTDGIIMWGIQLEVGSFPTSYIPTSGSQKNRSPDIVSISGDNFGTYRTNLATHSNLPRQETINGTAGIERLLPISYYGLSPSNKYDSTKLIPNTENSGVKRIVWSGFTANVASRKTFSLYAKASGFRFLHIRNRNHGKCFDLINGTMSTGYRDGTTELMVPDAAAMEDVGNGWYRCSVTSPDTTNFVHAHVSNSATTTTVIGNGTDGIEVYGVQIEEGYLTNYIPSTDTFTSRLGNATYVDSNGLIKTAYKNYVGNTDFASNWAVNDINNSANQTTILNPFNGYDGVTRLHKGSAATSSILYQDGINVKGTISVYAKADTSQSFNLISQPINSTTQSSAVTFNVLTGTIVDTFNGATGSIENVGNGWYRCIMHPSHESRFILINPHNTDSGSVTYSSLARTPNTAATSMYFYGIQNVDSTTEAGDFYPNLTGTKSGPPRYNHDPETLTPTGLYLEPEETNHIHHSNHFHNPNNWNYNGGSVAIDNTIAAPTGETGVAVFTEDTTLGVHHLNASASTQRDILLSSGSNTVSLFVKPLSTRNIIHLRINAIGTNSPSIDFKLDDQTVHYRAGTSNTTSQNVSWTANAYVEKYQNDWYRLVLNYDFGTANKSPNLTINTFESDDITNIPNPFQGNGQKTMAFFGLQNEAGSYASSYIDTTGSTVTRNPDIFTSTKTTVLDRDGGNKEAFYNQGGNISSFCEHGIPPKDFARTIDMSPQSYLHFTQISNNTNRLIYRISAGFEINQAFHSLPTTTNQVKTTIRISSNSAFGSNGSVQNTNLSVTLPSMTDTQRPTRLVIGQDQLANNTNVLNSTINRMTFWKKGLPDSSLINITNT